MAARPSPPVPSWYTPAATSLTDVPRLAGDDTLDDSPLRSLRLLDDEALGLEVVERIAQQVVGREAHRERVEQPLPEAHGEQGAAYVLEE
jgi:hypothetical protein